MRKSCAADLSTNAYWTAAHNKNWTQRKFLPPGKWTRELYPWSQIPHHKKITTGVQMLNSSCVISLLFELKQANEILLVFWLSEKGKDYFYTYKDLKHWKIIVPLICVIISVAELFYSLLTVFSQGESLNKNKLHFLKALTRSLSSPLLFR